MSFLGIATDICIYLGLLSGVLAIASGVITLRTAEKNKLGWIRIGLIFFGTVAMGWYVGLQLHAIITDLAGNLNPIVHFFWSIQNLTANLSLMCLHWIVGRDSASIASGLNKLKKVNIILERL